MKVLNHEDLSSSIMKVLTHEDFCILGLKSTSTSLVTVFWAVGERHAQGGLIIEVSKWQQNNAFTPGKFLKEMDMHGSILNYEGIEILRCLEIRGKNSWYFHMSILPSTSRLQRFQ
jgi:hypothetical protein